MSLLSIQNLTCSQSSKLLFESVTFGIERGEKVALIGINGCGKSTLLKTIIHAYKTPSPSVVLQKGVSLSYLEQLPTFNPDHTILDHLFRSDTPTATVIRDYHRCLEDPNLHDHLGDLSAKMDLHNAWDYEAKMTDLLQELNIHHLSQKMGALSGGMIKKIGLAQLFFEDSDFYVLDEPTNHLDIDTITWLEDRLKRLDRTLLMVTHDRYFLDKICTRILEIDQKKLYSYKGNYQDFLTQKDVRLVTQQKEEDKIQAIMRVELEWLRRGPKARSTKQKARIQRYEAMENRDKLQADESFELGVSGRRLGKKILELKDVSKSFDNTTIFRPFSYTFKQQEKIGVLGKNGSGKSTLLNLIAQRLEPDSGQIDVGDNTVFGYFDQQRLFKDPSLSIYDHTKQIGEQITLYDGTRLSAAKLLERFLFPSSVLKTKISDLSGGEQRRLQLVCMLLTNPNFLLFDEPTNDLDITTLSILEDFLLTFPGCVIVISHDRYFMDRVVDQLLIVDEKKITHFSGTYSDYAEFQNEQEQLRLQEQKKQTTVSVKTSPLPTPTLSISKQEKQEFKKLETQIEKLEEELKSLNKLFLNYDATPLDFERNGKRIKEVSDELAEKTARWEILAEKM